MTAYLGHVQRAIITRLAEGDQTTVTLADIASSSVISNSLGVLAGKGLARVTGGIPARGGRGGRPREIWSITPKGREEHAALAAEVAR